MKQLSAVHFEATDDDLNIWAPATCVRHLYGIPGFWLPHDPDPAVAGQ